MEYIHVQHLPPVKDPPPVPDDATLDAYPVEEVYR